MKSTALKLCLIQTVVLLFSWAMNANASYCASNGNITSYEWMDSFNINGDDFVSGRNTSGYYEHLDVATLTPGENSITLTPGYSSTTYIEKWRGWLDLNNDNQFTPDEQIFEANGSNAQALSFDLPDAVETGLYSLRIIMRYGSFPTPCGTYTYGETEDIVVSIETDSVANFSHHLTLDYDFTVHRDGSIGENVSWVVESNGEIALQRNASGELKYKYYRNYHGDNIRVWLQQFINGAYEQISNAVEYTPGTTNLFELNLGSDYELSRSGNLGDSVQWVIEKDGIIVLERNAASELSYTYFANTNGSNFRVWLKQFIGGEYKVVSNTIEYQVGQVDFSLTVDQQFALSRNGQLGDSVTWVIEEDGNIVLERNAANELQYTYFNNKPGSSYLVWLKMFINGQYEIVSNIVEYEVPASYPYTLSVGANYELTRTGNIGDPLNWVIIKNGSTVLQRYAGNELSYTYYSNTSGSTIQVYLQQFINGMYQPVSNTVQYSVP